MVILGFLFFIIRIMAFSEDQYRGALELQNKLETFRVQLEECDYINEKTHFFELMNEFWKFLSSYKDADSYELFEHSEYFTKYQPFFKSQEDYYVRTLEAIEAVSIMTKQFETKSANFMDFFDHQMSKECYLQTSQEMNLLNHGQEKSLVMVGCGPLPETLMYISENTNFESIHGLDSNQEAIYMAGEMLSSQGIDKIKLIHYDGLEYDYADADVIYVANFTRPKKKVLDRIAETAKNGAKILVRTPVLLGKMLYEDAEEALHKRLTVIKEGKVNDYFLFKPLLLQKVEI